MTVEHLIVFNLALFAAMASPGPALLVAIQTTLGNGRAAGIAVGAGLAVMAACWTLMALLGLEVVFGLFPWAYVAVKSIGAVYLIYIAWKMWVNARAEIQTTTRPAKYAFRQGLMVNALNPKAVVFAAAVLVVIFPKNMTMIENGIVIFNHLFVEIAFYSMLAVSMSTQVVRDKYLKAKVYIDRGAAIVLGALGLRLLVGK